METMENNTVSSTHQEKAKKMRKLRRWQIIVSLFGVAVIVWGVIEIVFLFLGYKQTETSNDAQIEQYVSPVNCVHRAILIRFILRNISRYAKVIPCWCWTTANIKSG